MANDVDRAYLQAMRNSLVTKEKILAVNGGTDLSSYFGKTIVTAALAQAPEKARETIGFVAQNYSKIVRAKRGSFQQMYAGVGEEAMNAAVNSFKSIPHSVSGYRRFERDSGGKLVAALQSPNMFLASYDGISFISKSHLDRSAKQWYRLNFGAGPAKGFNIKPQPARGYDTRVVMFGVPTGLNLDITHNRRSPNFKIPAGKFVGTGSGGSGRVNATGASYGDAFYPGHPTLRKGKSIEGYPYFRGGMSKSGIAAQRFLDAGVVAIAKGAPRGNEVLIRKIAEQALNDVNSSPVMRDIGATEAQLRGVQRLSAMSLLIGKVTQSDEAVIRRAEASVLFGSSGQRY